MSAPVVKHYHEACWDWGRENLAAPDVGCARAACVLFLCRSQGHSPTWIEAHLLIPARRERHLRLPENCEAWVTREISLKGSALTGETDQQQYQHSHSCPPPVSPSDSRAWQIRHFHYSWHGVLSADGEWPPAVHPRRIGAYRQAARSQIPCGATQQLSWPTMLSRG